MSQQEMWNKKFSKVDYLYGLEANEFLKSKENLLKKDNKLLCLGEGEGRNAIYFAKKGFDILALDASNIGLEKLERLANKNSLNVQTCCIDLNDWEENNKYFSIIASYLHLHEEQRDKLFKKIEDLLEIGGYFIMEGFSKKQLNYKSGGPKDENLLYCIEDFENRFENCTKQISEEIVTLNEGVGHQGQASVIRVIIKKGV